MKLQILLFLLLCKGLLHAEFVDGFWNGKPWDLTTLKQQARSNETDALAEWAFSALESHADLPHDRQLIFRRSKLAAEKGSPLGKAVYAICAFRGFGSEINDEEGRKRMKVALEAGHPEAIRFHGIYIRAGYSGYRQDIQKGMELIRQAMAAGSINAQFSHAESLSTEEYGELDYEEAAQIHRKLLVDHGLRRAAAYVFRFFVFGGDGFRDLKSYLTPDHFQKAEAILKDAAKRNHHYSEYLLIYRDIIDDKLHESIPKLIQNSRMGPESHRTLKALMYNHRTDHDSRIPAITTGNTAYRRSVETAFRMGMRNDDEFTLSYAWFLISRGRDEAKEAINILIRLIHQHGISDPRPSYQIGRHFCRSYYYAHREGKVTQADKDSFTRGMNHLILHGHTKKSLSSMINFNHREQEHEMSDPAKGLAVLAKYEKFRSVKPDKAARTRGLLLRQMNQEDIARAETLIAQRYPYGIAWRRKAFEALQKIGDIHPDEEFDHDEDTENDNEGGL